jgi:hypothetical protein
MRRMCVGAFWMRLRPRFAQIKVGLLYKPADERPISQLGECLLQRPVRPPLPQVRAPEHQIHSG